MKICPQCGYDPTDTYENRYLKRQKEKKARAPFGKWESNGLNFSKSLTNPNSRLARVVNFIREKGTPQTRHTLNVLVFGLYPRPDGYLNPKTKQRVTRGWGAYLFSLAVKTNILKKTRKGNEWYYSLGKNATRVVK